VSDAADTTQTFNDLRQRASWTVQLAAPMRDGLTAGETMDTLARRYEVLWAELGPIARDDRNRASLNAGYLDSVPWNAVFDSLSASGSLPLLELLRQRLDRADPKHQMGREFLVAFGESFMARVPVDGNYLGRIRVGAKWLGTKAGELGVVHGQHVVVPDDAVATYQIIGRYMLLDVAHAIERDLNENRAGAVAQLGMIRPMFVLEGYGIAITIEQSNASKVVWAWIRGDFEYLLGKFANRAWGLVASRGSVAANSLSLETVWSDGGAVRMSKLLEGGSRVGWVAQFDASRTSLTYGARGSRGLNELRRDGVVLAMSGAYVDGFKCSGGPAEFSASAGAVDNYMIEPDKGGLVALSKGPSALSILDIRRGGRLPREEQQIRPLVRLRDYAHLLNWLKHERGSAFQTHVLYADGVPSIEQGRADGELAPRHLLIDADYLDAHGGEHPIIAVVDLPGSVTLYQAMEYAVNALQNPAPNGPGLSVVAVANLDTGICNVLHAWRPDGTPVWGTNFRIEQAQNLVTIAVTR